MARTYKTATKFSGLQVYPNSLGDVQPGALQLADNVVLDKPGTVSPRRGQRVYSAPAFAPVCTREFQVGNKLFGLFTEDGLPTSAGDLVRIDAGITAPTAAATGIGQPPNNAMHSAEANGNVYLSTLDGIQKLLPQATGPDSGTIVPAGMPYGLDVQATLTPPGAGTLGILAGGEAVGYSVLYGNTDEVGNLILGAPSPSVTVQNPVLENVDTVASVLVAVLGPTALVFSVDLGYTATATESYDVYVVQGSQVSAARLYTTNTSPQAIVRLTESAFYFGPTGTPVTVVIPGTVTSVATNTTLSFSNINTLGLNNGSLFTVYTPFNSAQPASTASATLAAVIIALPSSSSVTVASGVWSPGSVGIVRTMAINAAQTNEILVVTGSYAFKNGDQLQLPGVLTRPTITAISVNPGSAGYDELFLDSYPTGLDLTGALDISVYRPSNVSIVASVPSEVQAYAAAGLATFYQLYRSATPVPIIAGSTPIANPNMQLAFQATLDGTATQITITDIAPTGTLGPALYTSPQQEGILGARYQPPVASDMCLYNGIMLYADAFLPASFNSQLLGVSSSTNPALAALQPGDILHVNGTAFTAVYPGPPGAHQFAISTGSGSVVTDINNTVANLSQAVNIARVAPTSAGTAFEQITLLSTAVPDTMGGTFFIQTSRGLGTFTLTYTPIGGHPSPFSLAPTGAFLPSQQQNALFFSEASQPEAVPLTNSINVGQANTPILRVLPLPGSCVIFKPEGVYQLTGFSPAQFTVSLLNTTVSLIGNETAVLLQSSVVAFTNQGVVTISQGGVQITSMAINDTLRALTALPAFASTAFAVADEAERRYLLWTPSVADDVLPTQAYLYNILTNAWSRWPLARVCGLVNRADQLLYMGTLSALSTPFGAPCVYVETSPGDAYPYGDDATVGVITVIDATTLDFIPQGLNSDANAIIANFIVGGAVLTANGVIYPSAAINFDERVRFTVPSTTNLATEDTVTYYQGYTCSFAPVPISGDDPGTVKQFQEFEFELANTTCPTMSATCATDFNYDLTPLSLTPRNLSPLPASGYGSGAWGEFPWGNGTPAVGVFAQNVRQLVSFGATRGHYFWPTVTAVVAANTFNFQGMTLGWVPVKTLRSR